MWLKKWSRATRIWKRRARELLSPPEPLEAAVWPFEELLDRGAPPEALLLALRLAALPLKTAAFLNWAEKQDRVSGMEANLPEEVRRGLSALDVSSELTEETLEVDFAAAPAVSFPYRRDKLVKGLLTLASNPWRQDPREHRAEIYRPLGLVFFGEGVHSAAAGALKGRGRIRARVVDLSPVLSAGLRVVWREGKPWARLPFWRTEIVEPFPQPEWAPLWQAAARLFEEGLDLTEFLKKEGT